MHETKYFLDLFTVEDHFFSSIHSFIQFKFANFEKKTVFFRQRVCLMRFAQVIKTKRIAKNILCVNQVAFMSF